MIHQLVQREYGTPLSITSILLQKVQDLLFIEDHEDEQISVLDSLTNLLLGDCHFCSLLRHVTCEILVRYTAFLPFSRGEPFLTELARDLTEMLDIQCHMQTELYIPQDYMYLKELVFVINSD
jgi:hypothetical protein